MYIFHTFGISSDTIAVGLLPGVAALPSPPGFANMPLIVLPFLGLPNFTTAPNTYTNGQNLDGQGGTLPSVLFSITDATRSNFATIWQSNVPVPANNVPLQIFTAAPTSPILAFNVPRVRGRYSYSGVFSYPNGQSQQIVTGEFRVE